jgi:hypothetical protein
MTPKQRPTAKKILEGIVQAMYDAQEPLDDGLVLVPPLYNVLLHMDAYQDLQSLLPRIRQQARKRLDDELAGLNKRRHVGRLRRALGRVYHALQRLLFAERYLQRLQESEAHFERAGEAWQVDIGVTAALDADISYLVVETDFDAKMPVSSQYKGRPTINIQRRTMVRPDGRFETIVSVKRPTAGAATMRQLPVRAAHGIDTRARLSFEDRKGRHIYYMTKPEISIGRLDGPDSAVDVPLDTLPDVSREHACIRYNEAEGTFAIRDLSRFGVTVNGQAIQTLSEKDWHPLPDKAELGLADVLFITFEVL